jgi:hypothetical protein
MFSINIEATAAGRTGSRSPETEPYPKNRPKIVQRGGEKPSIKGDIRGDHATAA